MRERLEFPALLSSLLESTTRYEASFASKLAVAHVNVLCLRDGETAMTVSFQLPHDIEKGLRERLSDLDHAAKEALLVEMYRRQELTPHQLSAALSLSRFETDALLKRYEVYYDFSAEDVARESAELGKLRGEHADRR